MLVLPIWLLLVSYGLLHGYIAMLFRLHRGIEFEAEQHTMLLCMLFYVHISMHEWLIKYSNIMMHICGKGGGVC